MLGAFNSIKGRLVVLFFIFLSIFLLFLDVLIYEEIKSLLLSSVDQLLHSKSQIIKGLLHVENGVIELELTEIVHGEYSIPRSGHYYKVLMDGSVLAASESLVDSNFDLSKQLSSVKHIGGNEFVYTSVGPAGEPIRVLRDSFEFLGKETIVYVASSLEETLELLKRLRFFLIISTPLIIILLGVGGYLIVSLSIEPLRRFSNEIKKITHRTLGQRIQEPKVKELKTLARSFNSMLERLKRAFDLEKRILSDASHELKTPLSVILAECDVILQKRRSAQEYRESIVFIKDKAESMRKTIEDILSLARLDSGLLSSCEFKKVDVCECISKAIDMVSSLSSKKGIQIYFSQKGPYYIYGDMDRLTEAFMNLLDNAIRYNKEGGRVDVSIYERSDMLEIHFKDTGLGITRKDIDRIFQRFFRADNVRNTEGTGLGLNIAREIIKAHGGDIKVESTPGKGTNFIVSIPLSRE